MTSIMLFMPAGGACNTEPTPKLLAALERDSEALLAVSGVAQGFCRVWAEFLAAYEVLDQERSILHHLCLSTTAAAASTKEEPVWPFATATSSLHEIRSWQPSWHP